MENTKQVQKPTKLSARVWSGIVIFGLFGQIAWVLENMYFNVFMDRTVVTNPFAVQLMVALSAVCATAATLVAGTISDRFGKRKRMMSIGYIIWGATVMLFALISVENTMSLFKMERGGAVTMTVAIIIVMDCIMSIVGSSANDAAFNAWVTDSTDASNRGIVEGVLAVMPILAMAAVFGGLDWMTADKFLYLDGTEGTVFKEGAKLIEHGNWTLFFIIIGAVTSAVGVLGLFLIKDNKHVMPNKESTLKDIFYGFKKSVMKENKNLYLAYVVMAIVGIANMSFIPYLITYAERTLGYSDYIIPVAVIIVTSAIASVVLGLLYDKFGKQKFVIPTAVVYIAGALLMLLASPLVFKNSQTPMWFVAIAGFVLMSANLGLSAILTAAVRDDTPTDKIGLFQGVRMCFWVLIPMVVGPLLTAIVTVGSSKIGEDAYGQAIYQYPPYMFAIAGGLMLLNLPLLIKFKKTLTLKVQQAAVAVAEPSEGEGE